MKESRAIPFSSAAGAGDDEPTFGAEWFRPAGDPDWPGHWASLPRDWEHEPEDRLVSAETRAVVEAAIAALPPAQREVLVLRDVDG